MFRRGAVAKGPYAGQAGEWTGDLLTVTYPEGPCTLGIG